MIEISISRELAAEHPGFMAGCAKRSHQVQVFGSHPTSGRSPDAAETRGPDDMADAAYVGQPDPRRVELRRPDGPATSTRRGGDALV